MPWIRDNMTGSLDLREPSLDELDEPCPLCDEPDVRPEPTPEEQAAFAAAFARRVYTVTHHCLECSLCGGDVVGDTPEAAVSFAVRDGWRIEEGLVVCEWCQELSHSTR